MNEAHMRNSDDQLTRFWSEMRCESAPFVHPSDVGRLLSAETKGRVKSDAPIDPKEWVEEAKGARVQLGLFPVPYVGDLKRADIIICLLNPGLEAGDFHAELRVPAFRAALSRSLRQDFQSGERYPFFFLDPQWCWTGGYRWWTKKLSGIISAIASHHRCDFDDATSLLACQIATIELFPYHSATFDMHRALAELPSCDQAREFVHQSINAPNKVVIVIRQVKAWRLPESDTRRPNLVVYSGGQERGAHLSPKSAGGKAILSKLGISETASSDDLEDEDLTATMIADQY
jgi:hypothetical protein